MNEDKKPENRDSKLKQAQIELLAADMKSGYSVIFVLTDLNDDWRVLWIEKAVSTANEKYTRVCVTDVNREISTMKSSQLSKMKQFLMSIINEMIRRSMSVSIEVSISCKFDARNWR